MEKRKSKPLGLFLILAFVFTCLSVFLFLFFSGKGAWGGAFLQRRMNFSLSCEGEEVLGKDATLILPDEGEQTFTLSSGEDEKLEFIVFSGDSQIFRTSFQGKESTDFSATVTSSLSLVIRGEDWGALYLGGKEALLPATSYLPQGGDLICTAPIVFDGETLTAPFRLFGTFTVSSIGFDTEEKGRIVLCPDREGEGEVYVSAPQCSVYLSNFKLSCPKELTDFYIKAKNVNLKTLVPDHFPVTSADHLARLADPEALPRLTENARIEIKKAFSLDKSLAFSEPVTLTFEEKIDFGENILSFATEKAGVFTVKARIGTTPPITSLRFSAPLCDLFWESDGQVPIIGTVEKQNDLLRYNNTPTRLGGTGTAVPTVMLLAGENPFLDQDVTFTVKDNLLVAPLPFSIARETIKGAKFHLSCEGGQAKLEGDLLDGVIVATDDGGKESRFAISVTREKYNIPVLYLETEEGKEITSKSQYVSATFTLDGEDTRVPGQKETHCRIRGRGNSTWKWDKKPYKIHFDEPVSLLGLPAAQEWALFSNYADKSLMRNRLAQVMAQELSFPYCPTQEFVDVFLNGEYLGVYTLGEHLEEGAGRVEVEHDMSQVDCGYFLEAGGVVSGVDVKGMNYFHAGLVKFVLVKGPEYNALTSEQFSYIKDYMQKANEAVKKGEGYEEYLDMESVVDWLIMTELTHNTDCAWRRSTYFTKNPGEKLKMGPVWDFDLAFGNFSKDNEGFKTWVSSEPEDDYIGETWSTYLLKDPEFQRLFRERWEEVRDRLLEVALDEIEESRTLLAPSADENFEKWDILGKKVAFERHDTKNYKTYSSQIRYLKDFLVGRAEWIDGQVEAFS